MSIQRFKRAIFGVRNKPKLKFAGTYTSFVGVECYKWVVTEAGRFRPEPKCVDTYVQVSDVIVKTKESFWNSNSQFTQIFSDRRLTK